MKQIKLMFCLAAVTVLLASGCSSVSELNSAMSDATNSQEITTDGLDIVVNKTTKAELIEKIGAPSLVFDNENGTSAWVYQRVAVRQSDLNFRSNVNFTAVFPYTSGSLSSGGGLAGVGASSNLGSRKSAYKTAGLHIQFDEKGCVTNYDFTATSF